MIEMVTKYPFARFIDQSALGLLKLFVQQNMAGDQWYH